MGRRPFTLLELIVILAVLTILSTLITEVIARSKYKCNEVSCLSNLAQIGNMSQLFSSDNNYYSLPSTFYQGDDDKVSFISILANQYCQNSIDVFYCPQMDIEKCFNPNDSNSPAAIRVDCGSYIMNSIRSFRGAPRVPKYSQGWSSSSKDMLHYSCVISPASSIFITDAIERPDEYKSKYHWSTDMSSLISWDETDHGIIPTTTGADRRDVGIHHYNYSFNVLFGDGHAQNKFMSQVEDWVVTHE